jgi:hypothetical protein
MGGDQFGPLPGVFPEPSIFGRPLFLSFSLLIMAMFISQSLQKDYIFFTTKCKLLTVR